MTLAHQRGNPRLEDARLLPRNGRQGIAQLGAMVQADGRDNAQLRRDHIRRIQPPSEPDLDDRHVHLLIGKPLESQPGRNLEKRQPMLDEIRLPLHQEVENIPLRDQTERTLSFGKGGTFRSICPDRVAKRRGGKSLPSRNQTGRHNSRSFAEVNQMRRSVETGAEADGGEGRCQEARDGAFAVGAGDMDAAECAFGMAQGLAEGLHPLQSGLVSPGEIRLLHRGETQEDLLEKRPVRRLRKIHKIALVFDFNTKLPIFEHK